MERAARWTKADIERTSGGDIVIRLHVPRWRWFRGRTDVIRLTIPLGDAALMHAQLDRILGNGQGGYRFDSRGLHPNYRGPVN
jgi:hypothetical protein